MLSSQSQQHCFCLLPNPKIWKYLDLWWTWSRLNSNFCCEVGLFNMGAYGILLTSGSSLKWPLSELQFSQHIGFVSQTQMLLLDFIINTLTRALTLTSANMPVSCCSCFFSKVTSDALLPVQQREVEPERLQLYSYSAKSSRDTSHIDQVKTYSQKNYHKGEAGK